MKDSDGKNTSTEWGKKLHKNILSIEKNRVAPNDFSVISNAVKIFSNQVTERGRNVFESEVHTIWVSSIFAMIQQFLISTVDSRHIERECDKNSANESKMKSPVSCVMLPHRHHFRWQSLERVFEKKFIK